MTAILQPGPRDPRELPEMGRDAGVLEWDILSQLDAGLLGAGHLELATVALLMLETIRKCLIHRRVRLCLLP